MENNYKELGDYVKLAKMWGCRLAAIATIGTLTFWAFDRKDDFEEVVGRPRTTSTYIEDLEQDARDYSDSKAIQRSLKELHEKGIPSKLERYLEERRMDSR